MTAKRNPLVAILLSLRWVALPIVLMALVLYFGRADFHATSVAAPDAAPQVWAPVELMTVAIPVLQDSGNPAQGAIVIFSEPELERATIDDKGIARATLRKADRIVFLAYAPGFALYQGDLQVDENGGTEAIKLAPILRPDFSGGEPLVKLTRTVRLSDEQGEPLSALLVLAMETGNPEAEPWVAISDLNGVATFPDATAADLHLEIYPAGFEQRLAMRIGAIDVPADQQETPLRLATARLQLTGLPSDTLFAWKRLDQPQLLPLHRITATGKLTLGPVPPGEYRLEVGNQRHDLHLGVGLTRLDFRQISASAE